MTPPMKFAMILIITGVPLVIYFNLILPMKISDKMVDAPVIATKDFASYAIKKKLVKVQLTASAQAIAGNDKAAFVRLEAAKYLGKVEYKQIKNSPDILHLETLDRLVKVSIAASDIQDDLLNRPLYQAKSDQAQKFVPDDWIRSEDKDASFDAYTIPANKPLTAVGVLLKDGADYRLVRFVEDGLRRGVVIAHESPEQLTKQLK